MRGALTCRWTPFWQAFRDPATGKLVVAEARDRGVVTWGTYWVYVRSMGHGPAPETLNPTPPYTSHPTPKTIHPKL